MWFYNRFYPYKHHMSTKSKTIIVSVISVCAVGAFYYMLKPQIQKKRKMKR